MKYNKGDIVLAKSPAGPAIPAVHVRLLARTHVKASKGRTIDWPEYVVWEAELVKESDAVMLKKRFQIPFSFPDDVKTNVYERNIIKIIKRNRKKRNKIRN
jgi:hypothetical protein